MIVIVGVENNRVSKFAEFGAIEDAQAHIAVFGGFVYHGSYLPDLWVDGDAVSVVPLPQSIPSVVSMRQARLALLQAGYLPVVTAAINAGSEADKITWEYATEVRRGEPLVSSLASALGLTDGDLDNLFALAESL